MTKILTLNDVVAVALIAALYVLIIQNIYAREPYRKTITACYTTWLTGVSIMLLAGNELLNTFGAIAVEWLKTGTDIVTVATLTAVIARLNKLHRKS